MEKYYDVVLGQGSNALMPVANASVTVLTSPGGVPATIYSDNGISITTNPLTTGADGSFSFYAANGRYTLSIAYQGFNKTLLDIVLEDDPANGQPVIITGGSIDNTPIGATTPSTGAFTTLSAATATITTLNSSGGALNGTVGANTPNTGSFTTLNSTGGSINATIGAGTPAPGAFTNIAATGIITPSQTIGIAGTTTNNNVNAGSVGEIIVSNFSGVSMTSNTVTNLTSISLTAGDWDVSGGVGFFGGGAPVGTAAQCGSNTTSATMGVSGTFWIMSLNGTATAATMAFAIPTNRFSLSATTTVFCVGSVIFSGGTWTASGIFRARRIR